MKYTIEGYGSDGSVFSRHATSYREARSIASVMRNGMWNRVKIIKGDDVEFDQYGNTTNVLDYWKARGRGWYRANP